MRKVTVFIDGSSKVINLEESLLITHDTPYVLVKKATIFWNYNKEVMYNSVRKTLHPGYRTFPMLKEIESYGSVKL